MITDMSSTAFQEIRRDLSWLVQSVARLMPLLRGMLVAPETSVVARREIGDLMDQSLRLEQRLQRVLGYADGGDMRRLDTLYRLLFRFHGRFRVISRLVSALYIVPNWQSPAFGTGLRKGYRDRGLREYDYYRTCIDAKDIMGVFNRYYTPVPRAGHQAFLTSSGMGAFFLLMHAVIYQLRQSSDDYIVMGKTSYVEAMKYIEGNPDIGIFFRLMPVKLVDEGDIGQVLEWVQDPHCKALFLDVVSNFPYAYILDFPRLFDALKRVSHTMYVMLDSSLVGTAFQPVRYFSDGNFPIGLHLIVFRSLLKYDQEGYDKAQGGVITYFTHRLGRTHRMFVKDFHIRPDILKFWFFQNIVGSHITDLSLASISYLGADRILERIRRHNRNARLVARFLIRVMNAAPHSISFLSYSGLNKEALRQSKLLQPSPLVYFALDEGKTNPGKDKIHQALIEDILARCKARRLYVFDGNSFGFNDTRFLSFNGYIRIAPGMEDPVHILQILECVKAAVLARLSQSSK